MRVPVANHTKQREAFGRTLIKFQHNRFELAQLKAETLSIKTTVDHCIQQYIDGNNDPAIAADKTVDVVNRCLQFLGGYGYMMEYPSRACGCASDQDLWRHKRNHEEDHQPFVMNQLAAASKPRGPSRYSQVR
jgi:alkylation response protein AidB-like acyl-CoA dehydrogenase